MRTMYKVEERIYTDCEGRYTTWRMNEKFGWHETVEEVKEFTKNIKPNFGTTGDWKIVETTMDEETFTVKEKEIEIFEYWKEEMKKRKKGLTNLNPYDIIKP